MSLRVLPCAGAFKIQISGQCSKYLFIKFFSFGAVEKTMSSKVLLAAESKTDYATLDSAKDIALWRKPLN